MIGRAMCGILPRGYACGDHALEDEAARQATRSTRGGPGRAGGRVAIPGGLGLVGVLVFVAFQLLSGGSGFAVPTAFDDGAQAPDGGAIPAGEDPEKDLRDFSEYVFDSTQSDLGEDLRRRLSRRKLYLYRSAVSTGCGSRELGGRARSTARPTSASTST